MKALRGTKYLPLIVCGAGLLGLLLRLGLYAFGIDEKGFMSNAHPLHIACVILAAVTVLFTAVKVRSMPGDAAPGLASGKNRFFPAFMAPLWFLQQPFSLWTERMDTVALVWMISGFCTAACFLWAGICLVRGKNPGFWVYGLICVFLIVDMLCRYRTWSGDPQLPNYTFHLFACGFLTLTAYYRAADAAGMGTPRMHWFCSLMAVFFCFLALVGEDNRWFYLGGALWSISGIPAVPQSKEGE